MREEGGNIKKKHLIAVSAVIIAVMFFASPYRKTSGLKHAEATLVSSTDISDFVNLKGTVVELDRREIYPEYMSRVKEINVTQGQKISKGDILMTMECIEQDAAAPVFYSEMKSRLSADSLSQPSGQSAMPPSVRHEAGEKYLIVSPIDGVVMEIYCQTGESLSGMFPCIAVSDMAHLGIDAEVSENNVAKVKNSMRGSVTLPAIDGKTYTARVSSVAPYAAASSILDRGGEIKSRVMLEITNPDEMLMPGFSASVKIKTDSRANRVVIPYSCINQTDEQEYVMVLLSDMTLEKRDIETGAELENGIEVTYGLSEGEYIVNNPGEYENGERVMIG